MSTYKTSRGAKGGIVLAFTALGVSAAGATFVALPEFSSVSYTQLVPAVQEIIEPKGPPPLDVEEYKKRMLALAHVATSSPWYEAFMTGVAPASTTEEKPLWPVEAALPRDGRAILPFNRIVAYYGNFYSKQMGILGEFEEEVVLDKLRAQVAEWEAADPSTPVVPAIEYIDVTAQHSPGKDGKYRLRMPDSQIDKAIAMAEKIDGIVILDIQVGLSTLEEELPLLDTYLAMPQVHLALDPEFAMHNGAAPGTVIGSFDAKDINYAAEYMARFVREHDLPPKILLIHRFTQNMLTNYQDITPLPEVQMVIQMDGWGSPQRKKNTYYHVVEPEPVQFTGFKVFYKNDLKEDPPRLLTPSELLELTPAPSFIQYQ